MKSRIIPALAVFCLALTGQDYRLSYLTTSARQTYPRVINPALTLRPGDPFFGNQWALENVGQFAGSIPGADIGAIGAWSLLPTRQSRPVIVAVIDTGVDYLHPDLAGRVWRNERETAGNRLDDDGNGYPDDVVGWNFSHNSNDPRDDHYHGTLLAGVIAAETGNGVGIAGAAGQADVRIMPLKCFDASASGDINQIAAAVDYAVRNGAQIINISWGDSQFSQALSDAIRRAVSAGCLVVAAAGNTGADLATRPVYPASFGSGPQALPAVIAVAAIDEADRLTGQSAFGRDSVALAAPGRFIFSTRPGGDYGYSGGTSVAAAFVSGVAALVLAKNPTLNGTQVRQILVSSARPVAALQGKTISGGAVHAQQALALTPALYEASLVTCVSAADYSGQSLAPDSIVAAFGTGLATGSETARQLPLPTRLAGSVVRINGTPAPLFAVTPGQINFLLPAGLPPGPAEVTVSAEDGQIATGIINIVAVKPAIFTASQSGTGAPAAVWTTDGSRYSAAAAADGTPLPVDAGAWLILACTGLRHAPETDGSAANGVGESVQISLGGIPAEVLYAGPQGYFAGLDQVNVRIPEILRGRGRVELLMIVAGKSANRVVISVR